MLNQDSATAVTTHALLVIYPHESELYIIPCMSTGPRTRLSAQSPPERVVQSWISMQRGLRTVSYHDSSPKFIPSFTRDRRRRRSGTAVVTYPSKHATQNGVTSEPSPFVASAAKPLDVVRHLAPPRYPFRLPPRQTNASRTGMNLGFRGNGKSTQRSLAS